MLCYVLEWASLCTCLCSSQGFTAFSPCSTTSRVGIGHDNPPPSPNAAIAAHLAPRFCFDLLIAANVVSALEAALYSSLAHKPANIVLR